MKFRLTITLAALGFSFLGGIINSFAGEFNAAAWAEKCKYGPTEARKYPWETDYNCDCLKYVLSENLPAKYRPFCAADSAAKTNKANSATTQAPQNLRIMTADQVNRMFLAGGKVTSLQFDGKKSDPLATSVVPADSKPSVEVPVVLNTQEKAPTPTVAAQAPEKSATLKGLESNTDAMNTTPYYAQLVLENRLAKSKATSLDSGAGPVTNSVPAPVVAAPVVAAVDAGTWEVSPAPADDNSALKFSYSGDKPSYPTTRISALRHYNSASNEITLVRTKNAAAELAKAITGGDVTNENGTTIEAPCPAGTAAAYACADRQHRGSVRKDYVPDNSSHPSWSGFLNIISATIGKLGGNAPVGALSSTVTNFHVVGGFTGVAGCSVGGSIK